MPFFYRIKHWLEKHDWYLRRRYSNSWPLLGSGFKKELNEQHRLYFHLINNSKQSSRLFFDIGANEGFVTEMFRAVGYRVIAVEPAARNVNILKTRFRDFNNVKVISSALSDRVGETAFFENKFFHAYGTASEKWKRLREESDGNSEQYHESVTATTTLDKLIDEFGQPTFVKIDVEGSEQSVLAGLTKPVSLLSFEAILPDFLPETIGCVERLASISQSSSFNFAISNKLALPDFVSKEEIIRAIKLIEGNTIEVFWKT